MFQFCLGSGFRFTFLTSCPTFALYIFSPSREKYRKGRQISTERPRLLVVGVERSCRRIAQRSGPYDSENRVSSPGPHNASRRKSYDLICSAALRTEYVYSYSALRWCQVFLPHLFLLAEKTKVTAANLCGEGVARVCGRASAWRVVSAFFAASICQGGTLFCFSKVVVLPQKLSGRAKDALLRREVPTRGKLSVCQRVHTRVVSGILTLRVLSSIPS